MTITDEQYTKALQTIKAYREERGMDFYIPINFSATDETVTLDEVRRYLELNKLIMP